MPGYHLREIKRGVFGEVSKITEEYEEFLESLEQKNPVMALVELSELALKDATKRAFESGHRTAKRY